MTREHTPTLTVVTTSKGPSTELLFTLDSIVSQDLESIECIVVEAESDVDREARRMLKRVHSRIIPSVGGGPYAAMNRGLTEASGEGVCFLNAGDWFVSTTSARHLAGLLSHSDWGYGATALVDEKGRTTKLVRPEIPAWRVSFGLAFVPHPSTIVRTQLLRSLGGFDLQLGVAADQGVAIELLRGWRPETTREVLAALRLGGRSTGRGGLEVARDFQLIRQRSGYALPGGRLFDESATLTVALLRNIHRFGLRRNR